MKDSRLFAYIGFLSALVTVGDFIFRIIVNKKVTLSPITISGIIITCIVFILYNILKDPKVYYLIKKVIQYYLRKNDSYFVENKECIYTFISRTEMEYTKKHTIVSNVSNLMHFCDKFKWSKEQKVEDIHIVSNINGQSVKVRRVENWHQYIVEFNELGKGQRQEISITITNLCDPNKESILFLSSNIVCRTKKLRLVVCFKDSQLKPINIKYKIFDNYACDFPLFQNNLVFDTVEHKIEVIEKFPIYGYKYEISWDFEND